MKNKTVFLAELAHNIREHRKSKCFTQESFAKYLKIARRNYCDIEAGKINPSILLLMKISLGLDVSLVLLIPAGYSLEELNNDSSEFA